MAVDQPRVIDIVSKDKDGNVVLTVSDHLDWHDTRGHLSILQEKINTYLAFLESGGVYEKYPDARGHTIQIEVLFHYRPSLAAQPFLSEAKSIVEAAGFGFRWELFAATPYKI